MVLRRGAAQRHAPLLRVHDERGGRGLEAVVGQHAYDASAGQLGAGHEPWKRTDARACGDGLAHEEEVVRFGAPVHGHPTRPAWSVEDERLAAIAALEQHVLVLRQLRRPLR